MLGEDTVSRRIVADFFSDLREKDVATSGLDHGVLWEDPRFKQLERRRREVLQEHHHRAAGGGYDEMSIFARIIATEGKDLSILPSWADVYGDDVSRPGTCMLMRASTALPAP